MIALLPLDDRPCNRRFPVEIAAIGGSELLLPPRDSLGRFKKPGDSSLLEDWLQALPEVDALIVSIDMLAYGGLVASRRPQVSVEEALSRLRSLREWRKQRPGTPIYAFNILMRLAITLDSDAAIPHYYNIMRWARLADEANRFGSEYLKEQLQQVEAEIPPDILQSYRAARARNHAINMEMVDWLAEGIFDFLLVTQEDCTEYGLHRQEQEEISSRVWSKGVSDKFVLHPGADEASLTLLARYWLTGVRFRLHVSDADHMHSIAPFEDVPYEDSLRSHITAMRGYVVSSSPDFELFVNAPVGPSQREEPAEQKAERQKSLARFADEIARAVESGESVAVCDVAFPNGADDLLMRELEKRSLLGRLAAFGAWNTAGNTTGTVLAQCAALCRAKDSQNESEVLQLNRGFVFERVLDDWCYQTLVRSRIETMARQRGISPLNMNGEAGTVEALTRQELNGFAHMLAARQFDTRLERLEITLPWGRTFEVEVGAKLEEVA